MSINPVYTAHADVTGGRNGTAKIRDAGLEIALSMPKEMGGDGKGANPEQLFAAGYSACFIGALRFVSGQDASLAKVPEDVAVGADVGIGPRAEGGFGLTVTLQVKLPGVAKADAERLIEAAHKACPYSNAVRGNIKVGTTLL